MGHELAGDIIRFSNNTAGIEKILKGILGVLLLPVTPTGKSIHALSPRANTKLEGVTKHVSVSRKIVRFLWFLDSALKALEARKGGKKGVLKWLIMGKWAFACVYAASEAITILHSMDVLKNGKSWWANGCTRKGNKFYFFSILCSVLASAYQLYEIAMADKERRKERRKLKPHAHTSGAVSESESGLSASESDKERYKEKQAAIARATHQDELGRFPHGIPSPTHSQASTSTSQNQKETQPRALTPAEQRLQYAAEMERKKLFIDAGRTAGTTNEKAPETAPIVMQLLADVCDLAIPASKVGWYNNAEAVGMAYIINAILAGGVIWGRVNAKVDKQETPKDDGPIKMKRKESVKGNWGAE